MEKQCFVKTKDIETKDNLMKCGFQLIDETNGVFTFLNNEKISFNINNNKVTYSSMLTI